MNIVELERFDLLRDRMRRWTGQLLTKAEAESAGASVPAEGRRFGFFLRTVVTAISAMSGGLLFAFLYALELPLKELVAAVLCIAASELSRRALGWRHTGAEEGWLLAGAWLLVFALPDVPYHADVLWLLLSVASALAGLRSRTPLFEGVATIFFCAWLGEIWLHDELVIVITLAAAVAIAVIRGRSFRSPFIEQSLLWIQTAFVIAGAAHAMGDPPLMTLVGAIVLLPVIGLKLRDVPTLWTAVPLVLVAGYEIGRNIPVAMEWKLMVAGGLLIVATVLLERKLRLTPGGWTSQQLATDDSELLELAATVAISPGRAPAEERGGGDFGGGGATERY